VRLANPAGSCRGLYHAGRQPFAGHAFVQNLCRAHYHIATDIPARHRLRQAFDQLAITI
jgi:hypothetical protein